MGCAGVKKPYIKHDTPQTYIFVYLHMCMSVMISHLGFLVGGGDGDGDSGLVGAPIYM